MTLRLRTIGAGLVIAGICTFSAQAADINPGHPLLATMLAATTTTFGDGGAETTQSTLKAESTEKRQVPAGAAAQPTAPTPATAAEKPAADKPADAPAASDGGDVKYVVKQGNKADDHVLQGWKTWRALDCARCHGAKQEGLVGPSLIVAINKLSHEEFKTTVLKGRLPQGMPPFESVPRLVKNIDNLYTYLKARADGKLEPGHVYPLDK
ncbi:MAG TPA: cytochrome c [Advenella sp.]|nr:cytochrome c [Advenella sp.]